MGGLGIAFRRRTQYKKKVEKVEIDIYEHLKLTDGAQIDLPDIYFKDHNISFRFNFSGTSQHAALSMVDPSTSAAYSLVRNNNGQFKGFSNGATTTNNTYLYGLVFLVHWEQNAVYSGETSVLGATRTPRDYYLSVNDGKLLTFYYLNVYDSTGTNLMYSLKPALLNKETPGLWDEVNQKFYGMTSETGTLTLG